MVHPRIVVNPRIVVTKYLTKFYNSPHHYSKKYGILKTFLKLGYFTVPYCHLYIGLELFTPFITTICYNIAHHMFSYAVLEAYIHQNSYLILIIHSIYSYEYCIYSISMRAE